MHKKLNVILVTFQACIPAEVSGNGEMFKHNPVTASRRVLRAIWHHAQSCQNTYPRVNGAEWSSVHHPLGIQMVLQREIGSTMPKNAALMAAMASADDAQITWSSTRHTNHDLPGIQSTRQGISDMLMLISCSSPLPNLLPSLAYALMSIGNS